MVLPPCDVVIKAVSEYVSAIKDPSNLDVVGKDVFKQSQVSWPFPPQESPAFCTFNLKILFCVHTFAAVYMPCHRCGGQRKVCGNRFSPSIMWAVRIQLILSGLVASDFAEPSHWPSPAFLHSKVLCSFQGSPASLLAT